MRLEEVLDFIETHLNRNNAEWLQLFWMCHGYAIHQHRASFL